MVEESEHTEATKHKSSTEAKAKSTKAAELAELKELLQRTHANFENYKKQTEKRMEELRVFAAQATIIQLLPLLDNFSLALKTSANASKEDLLQGVELIYSQLQKILTEKGLQEIPTEYVSFDPYQHEALLKVPSEKPENTILETLQKGYTLQGKVIRPAKVKISAGALRKEKHDEKKINLAQTTINQESIEKTTKNTE